MLIDSLLRSAGAPCQLYCNERVGTVLLKLILSPHLLTFVLHSEQITKLT